MYFKCETVILIRNNTNTFIHCLSNDTHTQCLIGHFQANSDQPVVPWLENLLRIIYVVFVVGCTPFLDPTNSVKAVKLKATWRIDRSPYGLHSFLICQLMLEGSSVMFSYRWLCTASFMYSWHLTILISVNKTIFAVSTWYIDMILAVESQQKINATSVRIVGSVYFLLRTLISTVVDRWNLEWMV